MPRGGRSSSRSSGRSYGRSYSSSRSPPRAPPRQSYHTSPPRPTQPVMGPQQTVPMRPQGGMMGGIGSTIVTGMALGAGSEVGHQAVRGIMGGGHGGYHSDQMPYPQDSSMPEQMPQQMQVSPQPQEIQQISQPQSSDEINKNGMNKCLDYSKRFEECMKANFNNTTICAQAFEDLKKCQSNI